MTLSAVPSMKTKAAETKESSLTVSVADGAMVKGDTKKTTVISGKVNGEEAEWYVKNGKVQLDCNEMVYVDGYTHLIEGGKSVKKHVGKLDAFRI